MRYLLVALLALCLSGGASTQEREPTTDVLPIENTYLLVSLQDDQILVYTIYHDVTKIIRGYALWNNSLQAATATIRFQSGDPVELTAASNSRQTVSVLTRLQTMSLRGSQFVDANIQGVQVGHTGALVERRVPRGASPLPTER